MSDNKALIGNLRHSQEIIFEGCGYCLLSPEDRDEIVRALKGAK